MPELVNHLDHGVRARGEDGRATRLRPGQVLAVEGLVADRLGAIEGVDTATKADKDAYAEMLAVGRKDGPPSGKQALEARYSELRTESRLGAVSVPLNTVIGDNDAPIGPPTGTITTKQAAARSGGVSEKQAYAPNERLPEEVDHDLSPVERKQAEARAALESVHNATLNEAKEGGNTAVDLDPKSVGGQAEEKPRRRGKGDAAE